MRKFLKRMTKAVLKSTKEGIKKIESENVRSSETLFKEDCDFKDKHLQSSERINKIRESIENTKL